MPHIHEKVDFTVEVYIVNDGAVLLREHDKYKFWLSVGGHIELDEEPTQAAVREVREETSLDVQLVGEPEQIAQDEGYTYLLTPRFMNIHDINESHKHVALIYFARSKNREIAEGEAEKSGHVRWFTKDEITDPKWGIKKTIQHYALSALAAVEKE